MKKLLLSFIILLFSANIFAQKIQGYIYDAETREPLIGAIITYKLRGETKGTTTDVNGFYSLDVPTGSVHLIYSFMGYESQQFPIIANIDEKLVKDIYLKVIVSLLDDVTITAERFEQKLTEVTVSIDVLSSQTINRQVTADISGALNTLPGVDINDKQPSIRGGSGWTYGVGSRSLILVDGMSVLTPGSGEINWNTIPVENIDQIEIIKGASSVLYGSSGLNGLINVRRGRPGLVPSTRIKVFAGIYGNPSNKDHIWWNRGFWEDGKYKVKPFLRNSLFSGVRNPMQEGIDFYHSRRIGNYDISGGLNFFTDEGFREQNYNKRFNIGGNITYHQPSENIINYGADINFLTNKYGDFFIWRSPKEAYQPSPFADMGREGNTININPFYNYTNVDRNFSHKAKGRFYYRGDNITNKEDDKTLLDILGNMGTDIDKLTNTDLGSVTSLLPSLITGDLNDVVNGLLGTLQPIFPDATTSDLTDLIAWFMKYGVPSGIIGTITNGDIPSDLIPWLANTQNPKIESPDVDNFYNYFVDYQYSKKFKGAQITTGFTYEHTKTDSETTGDHRSNNIGIFFQYDQRFFDRLSVTAGVRGEYYEVDSHKESETKVFGSNIPFIPVFRAGLNYQLHDYTFLRASFGQGYRYPSLIEKYARKDVGGVGVYPNHELKAEKSVNAELGIKQGYKIGNVQGFLDAAGFFTQYKNMIEFQFGLFNNNTLESINSVGEMLGVLLTGQFPGIGAKFYNVSKARIYGLDVSTTGFYQIGPDTKLTYNFGYVYIEPIDVDYKKRNELEDTYTDPLQMKEKSNPSKYLKYRQKHTFKATFDYDYKRLSLGINATCKSRTLAVDYLMVDERELENGKYKVMDYVRDILFGNIDGENLEYYWKKHNKSYFVMDARVGVAVTDNVQFQLSINNLFNKEYSTRPMALNAPRTFITQVNLKF